MLNQTSWLTLKSLLQAILYRLNVTSLMKNQARRKVIRGHVFDSPPFRQSLQFMPVLCHIVGDHPNVFSIRSIVLNKGEVTDATYIIDTENIDPVSFLLHLTSGEKC